MQSTRVSNDASHISTLFDLAPDGGCLAAHVTARAGALLPHRFTLAILQWQYASLLPYTSKSPRSGRYPASRSVESGLSSTSEDAAITRLT